MLQQWLSFKGEQSSPDTPTTGWAGRLSSVFTCQHTFNLLEPSYPVVGRFGLPSSPKKEAPIEIA